jgi:hypothetical protein
VITERKQKMLNDKELEQARAIQARLQQKMEAAAAVADMTPRGRDRLRARALLQAQNAMQALRAASDSREQSAYEQAYKAAFGLDQSRSAEDRQLRAELAALDLGAVETQERMYSALAIGDSLQARALAQIAYGHRHDSVGADYWMAVASAWGGSAPAVDRLLTAVYDAGAEPSKLDRFRDKAAAEIAVPSDLSGSLEALAADEDAASGSSTGAGASFSA